MTESRSAGCSIAIAGERLPKRASTDHDPLFGFHRWLANLRVLTIDEIKSEQASALDKNDPGVRAIAAELLDDALKKLEAQGAERSGRAEKTAAEQAIKFKAAREAEEKKRVKKRKSHKSIVSRLGKIAEPLQAIHDTVQLALQPTTTKRRWSWRATFRCFA